LRDADAKLRRDAQPTMAERRATTPERQRSIKEAVAQLHRSIEKQHQHVRDHPMNGGSSAASSDKSGRRPPAMPDGRRPATPASAKYVPRPRQTRQASSSPRPPPRQNVPQAQGCQQQHRRVPRAPAGPRPQSTCSSRRGSCSSRDSSQRATSAETNSEPRPVQRSRQQDLELEDIFDFIGTKAALRFKTVNKCMLALDKSRSGDLDTPAVLAFFRSLNMPSETSDRFFLLVGKVSRKEFERRLSPYIQPGYRDSETGIRIGDAAPDEALNGQAPVRASPRHQSSRRPLSAERFADAASLLRVFCEKMREKHKTIREAFRSIDADKSGCVSRSDFCHCAANFGLPRAVAEKVFELLDCDGCGQVDFNTFSRTVGPVLQPGHRPNSSATGSTGASTPRSVESSGACSMGSAPRAYGGRPLMVAQPPQSRARSAEPSSCASDVSDLEVRPCNAWSHAQRASAHKSQQPPQSGSSVFSGSGRTSASSQTSRAGSARRSGHTCVTPRGDVMWCVSEPPLIPCYSATNDSSAVAAELGVGNCDDYGFTPDQSWRGPMLAAALVT